MTFRKWIAYFLTEIHIIILCLVLAGALTFEYSKHEFPCPLCLLQRLGMISMAIGPMLNLLYGFRISHFAFALLGAAFGGSVSVRQILLHICTKTGYGLPFFGYELYTWAFFVACGSLLGTTLLLFLYRRDEEFCKKEKVRFLGYIAIGLLLLLTLACGVDSFLECGLGYCPDNPESYRY